jgi:hypothetical protein
LKEEDVVRHIEIWLEARWKRKMSKDQSGADFLVMNYYKPFEFRKESLDVDWILLLEQIECKGTNFSLHRAIGQCLDYYFNEGCVPTYLAIPEDYKRLRTLEELLMFFSLPIGILTVNDRGEISTRKEAKGKRRYLKFFIDAAGHRKIRSSHYQLLEIRNRKGKT